MKKAIISLAIVLATVSSVFAMTYDEAKIKEKSVVVMFHMHGCSACQKFSPIFDKFSSKFSNKFNFIKEDINSSKIASMCTSDTVPAFYIIQPKTQKSTRISDTCAWDKECLTKTLNDYNQ